jgi:hypothetical protein
MVPMPGPKALLSASTNQHCGSHSRIPHRKHKRLRAIRTPQLLLIERRRVKHNLVHDLRQPHGEPRGTLAPRLHAHGRRVRLVRNGRVRDVALVVRRVEIHAVPARRECDLGAQTALAEARGQEGRVFFGAGGAAKGRRVFVDAAVTYAAGFARGVAKAGVSCEHAEALGKSVWLLEWMEWQAVMGR